MTQPNAFNFDFKLISYLYNHFNFQRNAERQHVSAYCGSRMSAAIA